ncbi:MAG: glycosyltransferase family 39 protein [Candidatus Omnitrophica bacterium]|nr:glycosyltransferase family 39 protein [Candidatus Omnitrophota bacterium]
MAVAAAGGLVLWALATVLIPTVPPVRIPLPIAGGAGFPVPVWYWLGVAAYAGIYQRLFGLPMRTVAARAIRLGLILHLLFLLGSLPTYLVEARYAFASPWYARYAAAVWVLALSAAVIGSGWVLRAGAGAGEALPFFLPLVFGTGVFWAVSYTLQPWGTLAATVVAAAAGFATGWGRRLAGLAQGQGRERWWLAGLCVLALGVRLFYLNRILADPAFLQTGSDGPLYDHMAWSLAQGGGIPDEIRQRYTLLVPGYVYFIALVYSLAGRSYLAVCLIQAVAGAAACGFVYAIAKRLFGPAAGWLAAVAAAVDFPMVFAAAALGHQGMDLFWVTLIVWLLVRHLQAPRVASWGSGGIGLLLGWAVATRESNLVFWAFLIGWFLTVFRTRAGWRAAWRQAAWLTLGVVVVLLPVLYVELIKPGYFPGTATEGMRFQLGNLYFRNMVYPDPDMVNPFLSPGGALQQLSREPLRVLGYLVRNMWGNFAVVLFSQGYGGFDPIFLVRGSPYYFGMWGYAYLFGLIGAGLMVRAILRGAPQAWGMWMVLGLLASRIGVHLIMEASYRHRAPLDPLLILVAAYGAATALFVDTRWSS